MQHQKQSEFLVADFFPWNSIFKIGCYNQAAVDRVNAVLGGGQSPQVCVERSWYY